MYVTVEFSGIGRAITGVTQVNVSADKGTTYNGIINLLSTSYPGLIGVIINADGTELLNSNVIILNGDELILPDRMDDIVQEGSRLTLLSVIVGGDMNLSDSLDCDNI